MKKIVLNTIVLILTISCGKDNNMEEIQLLPTKAILIFPENNSECMEGNILSDIQSEVIFQWAPSKNTDHYDLQLTDLISKSTKSYTTKNTELPVTIERGTPYSWQITSINGLKTQKSDLWSFYNTGESIAYFIPFPAEVIAPALSAIIPATGNTITLEWKGSDLDGDIMEYDIYFGDTDPPAVYLEHHKESILSDIPVIAGKNYYWKIVTRDSLGNESSSDIFSFMVEP